MQQSSQLANHPDKPSNGTDAGSLLSPGFKSVVAMAGWDEEAILIASLVVDDTPERESKQKKRPESGFKTPQTYSRRKRRNQRRSSPIEAKILNLDEEEALVKKEDNIIIDEKIVSNFSINDENADKKIQEHSRRISEPSSSSSSSSSSNTVIPCMDRLREELSCAICLDICYEPSTTSCGHSFCRKCLTSAAEKCGKKCPKCRQLIINVRSCQVNTILWNTIQLLFPGEIAARKNTSSNVSGQSPTFRAVRMSTTSPVIQPVRVSGRNRNRERRMGLNRNVGARPTSQSEDAAMAMRLQREEFMEVFRVENESSLAVATARANLRAMASRAMSFRVSRGRP